MANGARMEGIDANLFYVFRYGCNCRKSMDHIHIATVGNPAMHIPTFLGAIPGMSAFATSKMMKEMEKT